MMRSLIVSGARAMINEKIVKLMQVDILPHSRAVGINFQLPFSIFMQWENKRRILLLIISILTL